MDIDDITTIFKWKDNESNIFLKLKNKAGFSPEQQENWPSHEIYLGNLLPR